MFAFRKNGFYGRGVLVAGLLVVLLAALVPGAAALHTTAADDASFSGDDAYDPAAGGLVFLPSVALSVRADLAFSARWAALGASYAPDYAAIATVSSARWAALGANYTGRPSVTGLLLGVPSSLSGDDAYDPAAGSVP